MPWCPNCKTEYREGIEVCKDCGAVLVSELPVDSKPDFVPMAYLKKEEITKKFIKYMDYSKIPAKYEYSEVEEAFCIMVHEKDKKKALVEFRAFTQVEAENIFEEKLKSIAEEAASEEIDGTDAEEEELFIDTAPCKAEDSSETEAEASKSAGVYVKKSDTAKDMTSTAATFFVFAGAILIFAVLNMFGVIRYFSHNIPGLILLFAMAIGCCLVGLNALKRSKKASEEAVAEDAFTAKLNEWMENHIDIMTATDAPVDENEDGVIDEKEQNDADSIELQYLNRTTAMKEAIAKAFGELDEAYVDSLIDEFYDKHF